MFIKFFKPDYQVNSLPSYQPKVAANPFRAFIELPLVSKYHFLLDDAEYFVIGFIKGPVCLGEIATESIRDQFNDRIAIVPGFVGSYPNFFFSVDKNGLDEFINKIQSARTETDLEHSTVNSAYAAPMPKSGNRPILMNSIKIIGACRRGCLI